MDISILLVIFILLIVYKLYLPKIKGSIGESRVARELITLPEQEYIALNDVWLKTNNRSSQIDHIVVSIYGIFVIETKNYKGWIHGNEHADYWTQSIYSKKVKFRNPIKQNWSHIYSIKEVLAEYSQMKYYPIVVFAGSAELKNVSTKTPVIYENELCRTIVNIKENPIISMKQVNDIAAKLNKINAMDKYSSHEHINQIKNGIYERQKNVKALICPRCKANLVMRTGPYSRFYGCSNYPKCRYKISEKKI